MNIKKQRIIFIAWCGEGRAGEEEGLIVPGLERMANMWTLIVHLSTSVPAEQHRVLSQLMSYLRSPPSLPSPPQGTSPHPSHPFSNTNPDH